MMRGQCCICTELFIANSDISAIHCGHTFHAACLRQWLEQSKTCPHCRKKINDKYVVEKLFFDAADDSGDDDADASAVMKNKLADITVRLKEKETDLKNLKKEKDNLDKKMGELRDSFKTMDQLYRQERNNIATLKKELQFHKELQKEAEYAKEEAKSLRNRLSDLKKVELVVNGNEDDIRQIISKGDVKQLSTWCSVLQKELYTKRQECKTLREKTLTLSKESKTNLRLAAQRESTSQQAEKHVALLKDQLKDADGEVIKLKKKITALEKALGSPSDTVRSFAHRLIHESPAPMMTPPNKKPKLTDPGESFTSPDMFGSPQMSRRDCLEQEEETQSVESETVQVKKDNEPCTTKYLKTTSASQPKLNMPKKGKNTQISDISNIHGIQSYNIFTKKSGMGLADNSAIRKGYNGLGGHESHITPQGFSAFKAPAPKKKPKFGPGRTVAAKPPLPSLSGFFSQS